MAKVKNPSLYRSLHQLRKGNLHRALHVSEGETISEKKLNAGLHSSNEHIRKMSQMAKTMKGFKH